MNDVQLTQSLFLYSIHGRNAEIIHILEEGKINPPSNNIAFYLSCFIESIKCHHNHFVNYFENNFLDQKDLLNSFGFKPNSYHIYWLMYTDSLNFIIKNI